MSSAEAARRLRAIFDDVCAGVDGAGCARCRGLEALRARVRALGDAVLLLPAPAAHAAAQTDAARGDLDAEKHDEEKQKLSDLVE